MSTSLPFSRCLSAWNFLIDFFNYSLILLLYRYWHCQLKFSNVECIYRKDAGYYRILDNVQKEAEARKSEAKKRGRWGHRKHTANLSLSVAHMNVRLCASVCVCVAICKTSETRTAISSGPSALESSSWNELDKQREKQPTCLSVCLPVCLSTRTSSRRQKSKFICNKIWVKKKVRKTSFFGGTRSKHGNNLMKKGGNWKCATLRYSYMPYITKSH